MNLYERIKELCAAKKLSIAELERKLDFSNGSIRKWNKQPPGILKLQKVADFFDVSTDFLLGRDDNTPNVSVDLDKALDTMMSFDGKPMTDHDREAIRSYLEGRFSNK